jgi:hypothetical protein
MPGRQCHVWRARVRRRLMRPDAEGTFDVLGGTQRMLHGKEDEGASSSRVWGTTVPELHQPSCADEDSLEGHDEQAAMIVDGPADGFEQASSNCRLEGGVVAP